MTVARNDPCPCGSGKKHKRCCLVRVEEEHAPGLRLRAVQAGLEERILRFSPAAFDKAELEGAGEDFAPEEASDPEYPEENLFFPWLLYTWRPERRGKRREAPGATPGRGRNSQRKARTYGPTMAAAFLDAQGEKLSGEERAFLEAVLRSPFSFFSVVAVEPGRRITLRDLLLEEEVEVVERTASQTVRRGDLLYGRVVRCDRLALLVGSGSIVLPPSAIEPVIRFRALIRDGMNASSPELLLAIEVQVRAFYFLLRQSVLHPPTPDLHNTDGDPIELHEIVYEVQSADAAFEALAPLSVIASPDELRADARRDARGRLLSVEFTWGKLGNQIHASWDNTTLGNIRLDGQEMRIEVNSAKRAKRIQAEVRRRLGPHAIHKTTLIRSTEALLRDGDRVETAADRRRRKEQKALESQPEVQAMLREMLEAHWEAWPDEPIPMLDGRTPMEAVKTRDGRDMVEALVIEAERLEQSKPPHQPRYDFTRVWRRLGFPS
jgi:hypothetical protein